MTAFAVLLWLACTGWAVRAAVRLRSGRTWGRHIAQAIDLTRPIGPEDRPDWGRR